jgi:nucleoside-diphosphate-sugar epimerase
LRVVILGGGFTGQRVARRFLARGAQVTVTTRDPQRLAAFGGLAGAEAIRVEDLRVPLGALVLHSIPPEGPPRLLEALGDLPARVVYLSTTGVYGKAQVVDESTSVAPDTDKQRARVEVEREVTAGLWSSLILRPAAIYGPGRGVQESIRTGSCQLGDNFVSRIHVDDLAAHVEAALLSDVTGAYPVADEEPCTSNEIALFCAQLLRVPLPCAQANARATTSNRRVDGSAIRRLLGIRLEYPSYRVGIPASLPP